MKKLLAFTAISAMFFSSVTLQAQEKPLSPPATATGTIKSGAVIKIDYSQPGLKGRTMGKDVEPMKGKVWRAGANAATVFEVSKDVTVEGKKLPAGKYAFFTIDNGSDWTLIFSKVWKQGGAFDYKEADDALRVNVKPGKSAASVERLTYTVTKDGKVSLLWGTLDVSFWVK